ncbi:MAG TPA: MBL fold metallo-hydrolase [Vicinamibacterales bacterium]|nr:MBL fold metallo-hydrolase [Vicinamibacterales bacterium]
MKRLALAALIVATAAALIDAQSKTTKPLEIWVVDVEGGKAALYVSPTGQTAIIDTGFPGARDLDRIMAAIADAGVKQIDYLISTHYHVDHIGNLVELAGRIPIGTFVDHGPTVEGPNVPQVAPGPDGIPVTKPREQIEGFQTKYADLYGKAKHLVVKPGDRVPITGLDWRIVTSAGHVLKTPALPGGGKPNPFCAGFTPMAGTTGLNDPDDAQSVGSVIMLGQFRALDFGDMWRTKELELMCPTNPIGTVDLYFASSHGAIASGSLPFVRGIQPRVAIVQNGTRKGGAPEAMQTILSSPGLEGLWQMHWSYNALLEQNSPALYIANVEDAETIAGVLTAPPRGGGPGRAGGTQPGAPPPSTNPQTATAAPGAQAPAAAPPAGQGRGRGNAAGHTPAYWLKVSAYPDGSFTISNPRNGFSKTYTARTK